ncbi:DNA polymerase [Nonomuraea sp. B12E4]|uniref:DNA polymerase n=1 Tax=Nonomuraea sp. B12E4 TaxID=3153564 RepID=UPI00325E698E
MTTTPIAGSAPAPVGSTTCYVREHAGHTMTIHAPAAFEPAAFACFAAAEAMLGLDVETSAVDDKGPRQFDPAFTVRLVQFGSTREAWVLDPADPAQHAAIRATLADPARRFVTHTPYDPLAIWAAFGIALGQRVIDTHLISKLIDPDERAGHGLKELTGRHLDDGLQQAEAALHARMRALAPVGHRAGHTWLTWGWNHLPTSDEAYVVYAGLDAIYVRRLLPALLRHCLDFTHLVRLEQWLAVQATGITIRGLLLDRPYTTALLEEVQREHHAAETRIQQALGFPAGSPRFAAWLDEQLTQASVTGLPRTPTGRLQVTADTLTTLTDQHASALPEPVRELLAARLAVARTSNLIANLTGFLRAADPAGRVHPQINTLRAKTARMSITGPALQTLKKHDPRLRHCFRADAGHVLVSCDFSQVEVRVAAALSDDPTLKRVIASGTDIHDATAALMYGDGYTKEQRTISKRCTFGTLYGGGAAALARQTGVTDEVARQVIDRWQSTYPRVIAYTKRLADQSVVTTPSGRRIPADPARGYANGNYMVQSTARDLLLAAVYRFATAHPEARLWLFVHDEVIIHAPERDAERLRNALQQAMTTSFRGVPIVADAEILGTHWGHLPDNPNPAVHQDAA